MSILPDKLIELLKTYLQQLIGLHVENAAGNEKYVQLGADDEERQDIADLCEEIDLYYKERANQKNSGLTADRYLESEVINLYKKQNPDATEEDCENFLREMRANLDEVLLQNAEKFAQEVTEEVDDSGETEAQIGSMEASLAELDRKEEKV